MYQKDIEVKEFEMNKANYPDTLMSGGLGPCIVIGVYDPKTRSGYMMHEPHFQYADLEGKIQEIKKDYDDLRRLKIFVAGNSLSSYDGTKHREFVRSNRSYVEQTLRKYFTNSQLRIRWLPNDHMGELFLCTSTGKFQLDVESDEMME